MTILGCRGCERMISVSIVPGGNPIARANPEMFQLRYGRCERCSGVYCEECIRAAGTQCPRCARSIEIQGPPA